MSRTPLRIIQSNEALVVHNLACLFPADFGDPHCRSWVSGNGSLSATFILGKHGPTSDEAWAGPMLLLKSDCGKTVPVLCRHDFYHINLPVSASGSSTLCSSSGQQTLFAEVGSAHDRSRCAQHPRGHVCDAGVLCSTDTCSIPGRTTVLTVLFLDRLKVLFFPRIVRPHVNF